MVVEKLSFECYRLGGEDHLAQVFHMLRHN